MFGLKSVNHGTIYPIEYHAQTDRQHLSQNVTVFGFQIVQAFRFKAIESICISICLHVDKECRPYKLFTDFDNFMYEKRLKYKAMKNSSMTLCIKVFINSLYGKFGEKHHDRDIIMPTELFNDDAHYKDFINTELQQQPNVKPMADYLQTVQIKNLPMIDLNNRDQGLVRVNISNIPYFNNHVGSFVYIASIITAVGRTQI